MLGPAQSPDQGCKSGSVSLLSFSSSKSGERGAERWRQALGASLGGGHVLSSLLRLLKNVLPTILHDVPFI